MNKDEMIDWLESGRHIDDRINALQVIKETASNNHDDHLISQINSYLSLLFKRRMDIVKSAHMLKNNTEATVIIEYYINCRTHEEIAKIIGYSDRQEIRIFEKSIESLLKIKVVS